MFSSIAKRIGASLKSMLLEVSVDRRRALREASPSLV
jgi:hypothetical protein